MSGTRAQERRRAFEAATPDNPNVKKKRRRIVLVRPPMVPYQLDAFFHEKRYAWIEGTTKSGKTYTAIAWLLEQAATGRFKNYWWVAPTQGAADIAYTRMKAAIPKGLRRTNDTARTITLPNGHVVWFKSGEKPDNLYGEDVGAVVIDEASRLREQSWHAIRSVITFTRGKVRAIGNVKGKKNWFYKKCRETQKAMASSTGAETAHWSLITASDAVAAGILPQDEIDDAKRELPHDVFMELYYGVPSEDGSNPFGLKAISAVATLEGPTGRPAAARGLDIARAVDWTVLLDLDADLQVAAFDRFQLPWEEFYKRVYLALDRDDAPGLADATGLGDPVVARIERDRPRRFGSYKFTPESKQRLMERLAVAIQRGEIRIPKEGPLRTELEDFEFSYTRNGGVRYCAPEGTHDDCVMALALALAAYDKAAVRRDRMLYPNWTSRNELAALEAYHQDCLDRGQVRLVSTVVPSNARSWVATWFAVFPNTDVVAVAEQPDGALHEETSAPAKSVEDYRRAYLAVEAALGLKPEDRARLGDPDGMGEGPGTFRALLSLPCADCTDKFPRAEVFQKCAHRLFYRAAPLGEPPNYATVRAAIGEDGARPKLYALKDYCPNFCFAMRNAVFREEKNPEKGASETVMKRDRGPADTALFLYAAKLDQPKAPPPPTKLYTRRER